MARKIDTGGLSQFYTGYLEQTPVMLLDYTMNLPGASTQVSTGHLTRFASGVSGRFALRINA